MAGGYERAELGKLCRAKEWSKAIRVLDSLLSKSCTIQDICNRAFCYSQLELHKHVVKDCDKALQLDPSLLQAYILKGHALSALGRKGDAFFTWEEGYGHAVRQSVDLKQLLELEELLAAAGMDEHETTISEGHALESSTLITTAICPKEYNKSNGIHKFDNMPIAVSDIFSKPLESNDAAYINKDNLKTKSISLDFRLSRGIAKVNEGKYDQAVSIFNQVLRENPISPEALIGRGTAYAFQRELGAAISDFSMAIKSNPVAGEAWKRRGQARAAMGEFVEAIEDLTRALEFEPKSTDILYERGIVNFEFKDYYASVEDLSLCVLHNEDNNSAYTYLGSALAAIGEYSKAEEAHLKSLELDKHFLDGWTHLIQFYKDLADHKKAFKCLQDVLSIDERFAKAYYLRGLLYHDMGHHRDAVRDLTTAINIESSNIECLYLRASCYHAIGEYNDAVKDYDAVLDLELDSVDKFVLQFLAFYQKEIALYTATKVSSELCWFDIDGDLDPLFKEYWCKRLHPKYVCEKVFRQAPLRESLKKGRLRKQDIITNRLKASLLKAADCIGQKIQYNCPGFLPNKRQYRMAGLAAIEIAQKASKVWRILQAEWRNSKKSTSKSSKKTRRKEMISISSQNRGGPGCSTSNSSETNTSSGFTEDGSSSDVFISWHDIYNVAVKWRQISEPCDPVVWINKLSEEFNAGFGSHTPLILGQSKVVRYFPNHDRTLNIAKAIMSQTKCANSARDKPIDLSEPGKLQKIINAESCSDLHSIVGENFWVATTCYSSAFDGKHLEGTRITIQEMDKGGFDFAIRTPCTPSRWEDFDAEMAGAWEIQSKRRSNLQPERLSKFVFIKYNKALHERFQIRRLQNKSEDYDLIVVDDLNYSSEWMTGQPGACNEFVYEEDGLTWADALCDTYRGETYGSTDMDLLENVRDAILRMTYYWYNFMPLARGSAAVGYVVLLGLFLSANMEVTASIPEGYQVDWEAILSSHPDTFISSVKHWLYPSIRINTAWKDYPDVAATFATTGAVVAALSSFD